MHEHITTIGRGGVTPPSVTKSEETSPLPRITASCHDLQPATKTRSDSGSKRLRVALAGNPNAGKSSLFNALTGARQHVGNWPGKTVERKVGYFAQGGIEFELVDLPGIYSLSAYSIEEMIARDFIVNERPDVVVCVTDASNLERNLYLTVQLLELGVPVIVALNMSDQATARGLHIDTVLLSESLGVPIVPTVGSRGLGMHALRDELIRVAKRDRELNDPHSPSFRVSAVPPAFISG